MIVPEHATVLLRALTYAGTIAVAGSVLFNASFPLAGAAISPVLRRQILVGFLLLLIVEPLRYGIFQLAISDSDPSLAFGPDLRWMGMETPIGQAAAVRLMAAVVIVAAGLRWPPVGLTAAFVLIGSYLLEGHTAASDARLLLAPLLFIHLTAVHWWLGALIPLIAVTRGVEPAAAVETIESFGGRAVLVVGGLLAAGALLVLLLTGGTVDLDIAYQQRLLIKLALVALLLVLAAVNRLRLTPLLARDYQRGAAQLRTSIRLEIAVAALILAATAWLVSTAPDA
jgi:putative copper resistance protein D